LVLVADVMPPDEAVITALMRFSQGSMKVHSIRVDWESWGRLEKAIGSRVVYATSVEEADPSQAQAAIRMAGPDGYVSILPPSISEHPDLLESLLGVIDHLSGEPGHGRMYLQSLLALRAKGE
jgi:hypothetical protein